MSFSTRWVVYTGVPVGAVVMAALALLLLGSLWPGPWSYDLRIIESGSMEPTIPTGAVVITQPAQSYEVGDIVTYQRRSDVGATTHRLVATTTVEGAAAFVAQGDANNVADAEPVRAAEIAGKVWFDIPYLGFVLSWLRSPFGFLVLVIVPAVFIVWEQVTRIRREFTKAREQNS